MSASTATATAERTAAHPTSDRALLLRRSSALSTLTIGWNVVEAAVGIGLATAASSAALLGFGLDATVEVAAAVAVLWRTTRSADSEAAERRAVQLVTAAFGALAVLVGWQALTALASGTGPDLGRAAFVLTGAALVSSTGLTVAKRRVARQLGSRALAAEARQTAVCAAQSAALLAGFATATMFGLWWVDGALGLLIAAVAANEVRTGVAELRA